MDKKVKRRVIALGVLAFLLAVLGGGIYASKIISKSSTESGAGQNAVVRQEEKPQPPQSLGRLPLYKLQQLYYEQKYV